MKKNYEKPLLEVIRLTVSHQLMENSGETDEPMAKHGDYVWEDSSDEDSETIDYDLWGY